MGALRERFEKLPDSYESQGLSDLHLTISSLLYVQHKPALAAPLLDKLERGIQAAKDWAALAGERAALGQEIAALRRQGAPAAATLGKAFGGLDAQAAKDAGAATKAFRTLQQRAAEQKAAALQAAQEKFAQEKQALVDGDLKKVPATAPPGLEAQHAAATAAPPADPQTIEECATATRALEDLAGKVAEYLDAEAKALSAAQAKYTREKQALVDGDLQMVPAAAPKGLEAQHGAVDTAKRLLPDDPKTLTDYQMAQSMLDKLAEMVGAYLSAMQKAKDACDASWNQNVDAILTQARQVPPALGLTTAINELDAAENASNAEFARGEYVRAQELHTAIRDKAQALVDKGQVKDACDVSWDQNVNAIYQQARQVPPALGLTTAINELDAAENASQAEYDKGEYAEAQKLHQAIAVKAQALVRSGAATVAKARPEITAGQESLATTKLTAMSEKDKKDVEKLIEDAPTEKHKQNLKKAVASGHSAEEVATFAAKIRDKDEQWIQDNLHVTARSTGTGVKQQFHMSCQATMVQAVKAELDPIYALKLHEENPDITDVGSDTIPLAQEQKQMLESDPVSLSPTSQSNAKARMDGESPETKRALEELLATATTNYERNVLHHQIGLVGNKKMSPQQVKASFERNYKGKGPLTGGRAVHLTDQSGDHGKGRGGVDLLNKNQGSTGLKYEQVLVNAMTRDAAVGDIAQELALGRPVPISVGGGEGDLAHYVLAVSVINGTPKTFVIHDPGSGTTVLRTEAQIKSNQMALPSGWNCLTDYVKPSPV